MNAGAQLVFSFLSVLGPQLMNEENAVHIHNGIICSHAEREEIMSFGKNETENDYAK